MLVIDPSKKHSTSSNDSEGWQGGPSSEGTWIVVEVILPSEPPIWLEKVSSRQPVFLFWGTVPNIYIYIFVYDNDMRMVIPTYIEYIYIYYIETVSKTFLVRIDFSIYLGVYIHYMELFNSFGVQRTMSVVKYYCAI